MASICELHKEEEVIVSASKQHFTFCTCAFLVIEYLKGNQVYTVTLPVEYTHSRGTTYEVETSTTLYIDEKIPEVSGTHRICTYFHRGLNGIKGIHMKWTSTANNPETGFRSFHVVLYCHIEPLTAFLVRNN